MSQHGTCPYCGNYNRLRHDQLYMHCIQCGKPLEIEPGGWLVPADVKALALYEESIAHLTDEDITSAANEYQKTKRKQRIKESALMPSAQLLQDYVLVEKAFKKFVQTGIVNLGLAMGTCGSILIVVPHVLVSLALSNNLLTYPNSFIEVGLILFINLIVWYFLSFSEK